MHTVIVINNSHNPVTFLLGVCLHHFSNPNSGICWTFAEVTSMMCCSTAWRTKRSTACLKWTSKTKSFIIMNDPHLPKHDSVSHSFWTMYRLRWIHNDCTDFQMYKTAVCNADVQQFHAGSTRRFNSMTQIYFIILYWFFFLINSWWSCCLLVSGNAGTVCIKWQIASCKQEFTYTLRQYTLGWLERIVYMLITVHNSPRNPQALSFGIVSVWAGAQL